MPAKKKKDYIIVFVTVPNSREAKKIARALLVNKEAACINLIDNVSSFFNWKGRLERAKEILMVIKTKRSLFEKIQATVKKYHSYTVPEIITLSITAGIKSYLHWIDEVTG